MTLQDKKSEMLFYTSEMTEKHLEENLYFWEVNLLKQKLLPSL